MFKKVPFLLAIFCIVLCSAIYFGNTFIADAATGTKDIAPSSKQQLRDAKKTADKATGEDLLKSDTKQMETANLPADLDVPNLQKNVHAMVLEALKMQGLPMTPQMAAFTPEKIIVTKKEPFSAGNMNFFIVSLAIKAPTEIGGNVTDPETDMEKVIVLAVDPSGTYHFQDVLEIATNKSMALEAKRIVQRLVLPKDFGDVLFTGTGNEEVVFVSDVFCPFCRDAYEYFLTKKSNIKTFKMVHHPIKELHPAAEIVSHVMEYARDEFSEGDYQALVTFAYTELKEEKIDPAAKFGESTKALEALELVMVKKLTAKYPDLLKKHSNDDQAFYYFLKGKYTTKLEGIRTVVRALGLQGTPAMYINGYLIRGFNVNELNSIFK